MQVVVEVYASHDLAIKPHLLLSLVLYKMVDPQSVSFPMFLAHAQQVVYCANYRSVRTKRRGAASTSDAFRSTFDVILLIFCKHHKAAVAIKAKAPTALHVEF